MGNSTVSSHIVTDQSGRMRKDVFYKMSASDYLNWEYLPDTEKQDLIVLHPKPTGEEDPDWLRAETTGEKHSARRDMACIARGLPRHQRQPFVERLEGDLAGGPAVAEFVMDVSVGWFIVTAKFARLLRATDLEGYDLQPFRVLVNQSEVPDIELFHLQAIGSNCERPLKVVRRKNLCPFCEGAPVVCETCGYRWFTCQSCGREMYVTPSRYEGDGDKRLLIEPARHNRNILEGHRWDGADFVGSHGAVYFSKRALDWMMRIHAGPLVGIPARFCIDGMNAAGLERLAKITDTATVEG